MRRLVNILPKLALVFFVGLILAVCSTDIISAHTTDIKVHFQATDCSSCHSHEQATASSNSTLLNEEDDEPFFPPAISWLQLPVNLQLLYLFIVPLMLWVISSRHKILLTSQLRL